MSGMVGREKRRGSWRRGEVEVWESEPWWEGQRERGDDDKGMRKSRKKERVE